MFRIFYVLYLYFVYIKKSTKTINITIKRMLHIIIIAQGGSVFEDLSKENLKFIKLFNSGFLLFTLLVYNIIDNIEKGKNYDREIFRS